MSSTPPSRTGAAARPEAEWSDVPDDPRLMQAVQEFLEQLESGRRPNRQELLRRYPDLARPLAQCLDGLELVHRAGGKGKASLGGRTGPFGSGDSLPTEPLGDFQLMREVGRGGMGIVYEAVQLSLGRRVALKVLPFAATLDAKHLQRFHNEAHAAAQLHHTNIVPVYAVGCERGVHFYAMQLIDGQSLATAIRQTRQQEGRLDPEDEPSAHPPRSRRSLLGPSTIPHPPPPPPPGAITSRPLAPDTSHPPSLMLTTQRSARRGEFFRTAARLMIQAAEALEHAHQYGIVHRDVKPANLLVEANGRLWVTDFGLAQFQADAGLTQTGDILGTLRYMSPEQASGQRVLLDHRTDIYSLGATLYELVTLEPIFPGRNRQELLRQIMHDEPRAPRALDRTIPVELETIILKAVGKTPAERYASARELAADLDRYLEDKPVLAKRPGLVEKATKWARRHRPVVISAVVALLLTVAGLGAATVLTARAYDRERQKAHEAAVQRTRAEENFRQAWQVVDQFAQIGEEELAGDVRLEALRRRLLVTALAYYQNFIDQRRDDPSIQEELKASRAKVNAIVSELTTLMGAGQYMLLYRPHVQEELKLSPEQREVIAGIGKKWREAFGAFNRMDPAQREKVRLALAQEQERAVARSLDPRQLRRFKQIARQDGGPFAFSDPDVVEALRLTAAQKKQIRAIQDKARSLPMWPRGRGRNNYWRHLREARKQAQEKILALLTEAQQRKWQELVGEPMRTLEAPLPGPPPGRKQPFGPPPGPPH